MEYHSLSKEDVEFKNFERTVIMHENFQDSDTLKVDDSDDDDDDVVELLIKPAKSSSKLDTVSHHKHKNKRRHSKKSCKKHHHHSHRHKHSHTKSSDADLYSKRNRKMEQKYLHYRKSRRKIDIEASINDSDADQNIKSKELMKDVVEKHSEKDNEYQEVTDVRNIKIMKDIRETDDYINRKVKRSTNSLDELLIEWRKKRLVWLQHYKKQENDLQYRNNDKEMSENNKSSHTTKYSTNEKKSTNHLQIESEEHYDFISLVSSEESMDYEENEKSEDLTDKESEYESDKKEERTETESNNLNEKVLLNNQSPSMELIEETKPGTTLEEEILKVEVSEENQRSSIVSPKKFPQLDDIQTPVFPVYYPAIQGCRSIDGFHVLNRIEEGTYGVVYRARDKKTKEIVALKRLKMEREKEGFPITSLREINTLLKSQHPNIVSVREIVVGSHMDRIYIVMDYVEHDLKSLMKIMSRPFYVGEVKTLLMQLLCAVAHLHDNWILHRDLKTSNLLLSHQGILKVGDFGLAREYGSPLKSYTPVVVTLWYRAPELLLGAKKYSTAIDMWSVGCVFAELLTKNALFPGKSELDQITRIFKELGTPSEKIWPGFNELPLVQSINITRYPYNNLKRRFSHSFSDMGFDLLNKFLTYDPTRRMSAEKALSHEFFNETPKPVPPNMFPTWPAKSEQAKHKTTRSPKAPIGGMKYSK